MCTFRESDDRTRSGRSRRLCLIEKQYRGAGPGPVNFMETPGIRLAPSPAPTVNFPATEALETFAAALPVCCAMAEKANIGAMIASAQRTTTKCLRLELLIILNSSVYLARPSIIGSIAADLIAIWHSPGIAKPGCRL